MSQAFDDNTGMPRSLNDIEHTVKTLWLFVRRTAKVAAKVAAKAVAKGLANVLTKGLTKPVVRREILLASPKSPARWQRCTSPLPCKQLTALTQQRSAGLQLARTRH